MDTDPRHWLAALRKSHENLVTVLSHLSSDQLEGRSYCRDWRVAQVLSHLGSGAEITLSSLERVLAGGLPLPREEFQPIWERWESLGSVAKAAQLVVWDRRCVSVFQGLEDDTLAGIHVQMFGMELDASTWLSLRLNEHALHSWDVAVAFDPDAELLPSSTELLVERLGFVAGRLGKAEAAAGPRRFEVRTTGPERGFLLEIANGVALHEGSETCAEGRPAGPSDAGATGATTNAADGTLIMPAAALIRLVFGRLDRDHTPVGVKAEGAADLDELRRVFPGF